MSLIKKAIFSGITRMFSLPRLSVPLILTLGLTLGAVLSVVAISSTLLVKPLQGVNNEAKVQTYEYRLKPSETLSVSYWSMRRLASFNERFKSSGVWAGITSTEQDVSIEGVTYPTTLHSASDTILEVLGTQLIQGENVNIASPEDYVWISNSFWQQRFSGLDSALGKQIEFGGKIYIIAGIIEDLLAVESSTPVLPQQVWRISNLRDLLSQPEIANVSNDIDSLLLKGIDDNSTVPSQEETLQWIEDFILENVDETQAAGYLRFIQNTPFDIITSDYRSKLLGDTKPLLAALFVAVVGLLLMATLNLLNLFIAHYQGRTKEYAIQLTLGASLLRARLLVFLENLPSFVVAAVVGLLVTGWVIKILPTIAGNSLPMIDTIGIDVITIVASVAIILALGVLFSSMALVDINKQALAENLNSSGKGLQAQSNQWLSRVLMVVQLSIASVLLTASIMLALQSYGAVFKDLGYDIGNTYAVTFYNSDEEWATKLSSITTYQGSELQQLHQSLDRIIEREVSDSKVVINSTGALSNSFSATVYFPEDAPDQRIMFQVRNLSPTYFDIFNIPFLAGSNLSVDQINNDEQRMVIDENMAKALFPDNAYADIIGKAITLNINGGGSGDGTPTIINGVVGVTQSRAGAIESMQMPAVYWPNINSGRNMEITVQMPKGATLTANMIEEELRSQFPRLTNLEVKSLEQLWQEQTLTQRFSLWVVLSITGLTLLLAAIGVSGLTQMTTNHRKYELAVRMATGARQFGLVKFILSDTLWMLVIGLGLGFVVSSLGYQQIQQRLDMLPDFSWLAMSLLDAGLIVVVLLSVFIPAWRVISSDPMQALRAG
ncbi:MAG: putative permease [Gammaproteobacteria bacterium]|jgi:predicted permease